MADKQTKKASLAETLLSTLIGFVVAISTQLVIFPWFGIHVALHQDLLIGAIFTVVSIARGFVIRRLFEHLRVAGVLR
jgi:ABC-type bacteriocin/lantibiotic exporter with double-glycine peptidase domain